jgi:nucleotide-binding universal stress UspA family protein
MNHMKKIFVPTDFSKCADNALNYAFELAKVLPAEIIIFSAIHPYDGIDNNLYNLTLLEEIIKAKSEALLRYGRKYQKKKEFEHIKVTTLSEVGYAAPLILSESKRSKADLIVMGTTGATGLKEIFLGSITADVINSATVPLLAIPEKAKYQNQSKVVFSTDFSNKPTAAGMEWMEIFNDLHGSPDISIVHVIDEENGKPNEKQEAEWSKIFGIIPIEYNYIHDVNISVAIQNYCESVKANVLAMVAPHHSFWYRLFFPSQSRSTVYHTRIPLLVLPRAK